MKESLSEGMKILLDNSLVKEIEKTFINSWFEQWYLKQLRRYKDGYQNKY
jgi:hypothetical protein